MYIFVSPIAKLYLALILTLTLHDLCGPSYEIIHRANHIVRHSLGNLPSERMKKHINSVMVEHEPQICKFEELLPHILCLRWFMNIRTGSRMWLVLKVALDIGALTSSSGQHIQNNQ